MALDTTELLKKVRKIEIKTKSLSNHLFSGAYHTVFKGRGMSFSEVREYQYGDDVRNIDWNVTARTGDPYIKVYEEERELTVMLIVDVSGSQDFGTQAGGVKKDIVAELAATLAFSAIHNNDKVGAIFFTDKMKKYLPPKKGKKNLLRLIRELLYIDGKGESTDIGVALEYLNNTQTKRSIVFIISDFISPDFENQLAIVSKRHKVIGVNIYDSREKDLPNIGLIKGRDIETGEFIIIDTSSALQRERYQTRWAKRQNNFKSLFTKYGARTMSIDTKEDYVKSLISFFKR